MTILWFTFLIVDKHLVVISPFLRKKIREDLKINGRYHTSSVIINKKCSRLSTDILDKLIKKHKWVDRDYYWLIKKYDKDWVKRLLKSKGWKPVHIDQYVSKLCNHFEKKGRG